MGWGAPKEDPKIKAEQEAEAKRAELDRINLLQDELGQEDQVRAQIYGRRDTAAGGGGQGGGGDGGGQGGGGAGGGGDGGNYNGGFGFGGGGGRFVNFA